MVLRPRDLAIRIRNAWAWMRLRKFAMTTGSCPFCGPSGFLRLREDPVGVRCIRCRATAVHMSLGLALREHVPNLGVCTVCELSARGPLVKYLARHASHVSLSEHFEDAEPGGERDGVRCEDVQRLTYADHSFDVVTHTEVLEHVPDDGRAFVELHRVLRPGGIMLFTVPVHSGEQTVERARIRAGRVVHLQPPAYHRDPLRGGVGILVYRDYGTDIVDRILTAGFESAWIESRMQHMPWGQCRAVIVARSASPNSSPDCEIV